MTISRFECFLFSYSFPWRWRPFSSTDTPLALAILAVLSIGNSGCFFNTATLLLPCSHISHFLLHLLSASTAGLAIDMASSPICHSTASLAIDMAPSDKEVSGNVLSNAKAIDMAPSDKEVLGSAFSNAKISKPSSPSSSSNNNGTSDKEVSSDEEEQRLFTQPDTVDLTVDEEDEDEQCTTEVTNKRGSS
jgi:hypothetical protein